LRGVTRAGTALVRPSEVDALRAEVAQRYTASRVELTGSGTQALQVAIMIAQKRAGGAVALPAFQCYDLASAAVGAGARVALYDLNPRTLAPDIDSLRRAMRADARTVVIAPLYGVPVEWESLAKEIESAGGVAIEDAAQGHGASWRGRPLGAWGGLSVLSFGRGKGWCGGSGGALLARNGWEREEIPTLPAPALADELRVVAQLKAQWILGRPSLYGLPAALPGLHLGETIYHPPRPPRQITRAAAAAARAHTEASDREAQVRRKRGEQFVRKMFVAPEGGVAGYLRMPVVTPTHLTPAHAALGVARSYPTTLAGLPVVRERLVGSGPYPGAEELAARLVTLPTHSRVTPSEAARIASLASAFGE
jgi:dTDP-4-amino-4,6-dideoxygalactose transaminase